MCNQKLSNLIHLNGFYFGYFNNDFARIVEVNFLTEYLGSFGEVLNIFYPHIRRGTSRKSPSECQAKEYVDFSLGYISKAEEIINCRAETIINILRARL